MLYRYDSADVPSSGRAPGLLLYFHGNNLGTQQDLLAWSHDEYRRRLAIDQGLIFMKLASPALGNSTLGGSSTRHWHYEQIPVIHEFLQSGLPLQFSFDTVRIVFWGGSQGTCFLGNFVAAHGTSYGGGLYAGCRYLNRDGFGAWEAPPDFQERFKVVVQATIGDFLHEKSVAAY